MQFVSTKKLYQKIANNKLSGFTVPAFNIRTLTFDIMKALFRTAKKMNVAAFIIELAQSEMTYTRQSLREYSENCVKAAKAEKYNSPIFLQLDHLKCLDNQCLNIREMEGLIKQALDARFYNIDIDCSMMPLRGNINITNHLVDFIKNIKIPEYLNVDIALGGEIGQIGGRNTSVEELEKFLQGVKGITKAAVQTGTAHGKGGNIDWDLLKQLSDKAKQKGLAGIVQHGASTLPREQFKEFPKAGVVEIHLATELMNTILESEHFPEQLKTKIQSKKDLGPFKWEILSIFQKNIDKIAQESEQLFEFFFRELNVVNTKGIV